MSLTRLSLSSLSLLSQSDLQIIVFKFEIFFLTTPDMSDMSVVNVLMRAGWRWKVLSNCKQPSSPSHHTNKQLQTQTTTPHHTTPLHHHRYTQLTTHHTGARTTGQGLVCLISHWRTSLTGHQQVWFRPLRGNASSEVMSKLQSWARPVFN